MTAPPMFWTLQSGVPDAGPIVGGGASLSTAAADTGLLLSPRLAPPLGSTGINVADSAATVGIGTLTHLPGCTYLLPPTDQAVINTLELMIDGITIATRVLWRVSVNGAPVPGWNGLTILGRNGAASIARSFPPPMGLVIPRGGRLDVDVLNQDGAAYTVGASLYGWQWPAA